MRKQAYDLPLFFFFFFLSTFTFSQDPPISSWSFAGIANGFEGSPNQENYIVSDPEIKRLDTGGGELWFGISPRSNLGCKQYFKVGWNFEQALNTLYEGQKVNFQIYNVPSSDAGVGLKQCYAQVKQQIFDGGYLVLTYHGSTFNPFHRKEPYVKYGGPKNQYFLTLSPNERMEAYPVDPGFPCHVGTAAGTMLVMDGVHKVGGMDAPYGSFCLEVSKGGVFKYFVMYMFDGLSGSPGTSSSSFPITVQPPVIQHNILSSQGVYWMQINVPGVIQSAAGKSLQVVIRFCDANGNLLPAYPQEATYRDLGGYAASTAPLVQIPTNNYSFNELVIWMPYYALNLSKTGYQTHSIFAYAEVFVDGKSAGVSEKAGLNVIW